MRTIQTENEACPIESAKITKGTGTHVLNAQPQKTTPIIDAERFVEVMGYPDYLIGTHGTLISKKYGNVRVMRPAINSNGYLVAPLCNNGSQLSKTIHRLVCEAFIPNPENKPQINHINGNKTDNRLENLEWATNGENQKHAYEHGLNYAAVSTSPVLAENEHGEVLIFNSMKDASTALGTSTSSISRYCKSGKSLNGFKLRQLTIGIIDIDCDECQARHAAGMIRELKHQSRIIEVA